MTTESLTIETTTTESITAENATATAISQSVSSAVLEHSGETKQFFVFRISEEEYCVDLDAVQEIKGWTNVTKLPDSPGYMRGVINVRGTVIPIFDLKKKFGMGDTEITSKSVVLVLNVRKKLIGVLADEASEILAAQTSQINPIPEFETVNFVSGLIQKNELMVILLDIERIFNTETLNAAHKAAKSLSKTKEPEAATN
jgi:purine-binding chemotaxis protein CheW